MDCKRVTVIRVGPVFSTQKEKHRTETCGAFLYTDAEKAGASHKRESHRLC